MGLLDDLKKQAELAKSQQISEKSLQAESLKGGCSEFCVFDFVRHC